MDVEALMYPLINQFVNLTVIMVSLGVIFVILSYIIGSLIVFVKNFRYRLTFDGELLTVKYGLLTVKKRTVPITRIQALKEEETLLEE